MRELRGAGHDVFYIAEFAASLSDLEVIALAAREGRIPLTADKDFGALVLVRFRSRFLANDHSSPQLADIDIDIEIDIGHAGLAGFVRASLMPIAVAHLGSADVGQL